MPQNLAGTCIVEVPRPEGCRQLLLVYVEHLKSFAVGYHLAYVHGVAVSVACSIQQGAVVVECCGTPENLVAAVAVDVGYRQIVVSVAVEGVASRNAAVGIGTLDAAGVGGSRLHAVADKHVAINLHLNGRCARLVEYEPLGGIGRTVKPLCMQTSAVETDSPYVCLRIIPSAENATGMLVGTVDVCNGSKESFGASAIVVAPETGREGADLSQLGAALGQGCSAVGILVATAGAPGKVPCGV